MPTGKSSDPIFSFSLRDLIITAVILGCAVGLCLLLYTTNTPDGFASPIFLLAVMLISRWTHGYLFGIIASLLGVVGVNYIFTFPYWQFNFTLTGYPLTFITMLAVSLITCTMTTVTKQRDRLRAESEREKMRADLLRSVSHDIRTPLTSIMGATSAVLETPCLSSEEQRTLVQEAHDEAQWLIRVVENLLSVTRIGDARTQLIKHDELAEEVLSEAVHKFHKRFPDITAEVKIPDAPLFVPMDPVLIMQVLSNLLENAVIHGKTTTHIVMTLEAQNGCAYFSVRDNGRGISSSVFPHLFDGTLPHGSDQSGDGKRNMGIGLSVCNAIISAHGGMMRAYNLPDGAEFSFTLPISKENES